MSYTTKNTPKAKFDSCFAKLDNYLAERKKAKTDSKGKKKDKKDETISD